MLNLRSYLLPALIIVLTTTQAQEVCDNSVDDDADGLIDLNDTSDCVCGLVSFPLDDLIPNPSFEDHDCIPSSYSQMDCAMFWSQGTVSSSDYLRTDGYMPEFIPQPLPGGGNGCVGGYFCQDYMEYVGTCLTQPLLAGQDYELDLSVAGFEVDNLLIATTVLDLGPVNLTVYGLATCPAWPTGISLCPGDLGWTAIGQASYVPNNLWSPITITLAPTFDVQAIMLGAPCELPPDYPTVFDDWLAYFVLDDLALRTAGTPGANIMGEGNWCDGDLELTADPDSTITSYQWYLNGVAVPGATGNTLAVSALGLDTGDYTFRAIGDTTCALSTWHVETVITPTPYIALTVDGLWCPLPGTYQWFLNGLAIPGETGPYHIPLESGTYTVALTNDLGCTTLSYPFAWTSTQVASEAAPGMTMYFNTSDGTLMIRGAADRSHLSITDAIGRLVLTRDLYGPDHALELPGSAQGIYVVRLNDHVRRLVR